MPKAAASPVSYAGQETSTSTASFTVTAPISATALMLTADDVADERGGWQHRPRRELPNRHGIQELLLGEPVVALDQFAPQEGD